MRLRMLGLALAAVALPGLAKSAAVWGSDAKLLAPDDDGDLFGSAVAVRNGVALVAALDDLRSGFVHTFEQNPTGTWIRTDTLAPADGAPADQFGVSVAMSSDRAVVGARHGSNDEAARTGTAYMFERQHDGSWVEVVELKANDGSWGGNFGSSVALDGDTALIGAPEQRRAGVYSAAGAAYVFQRQATGVWLQVAQLLPADSGNSFGSSVALHGGTAVVGAPSAGADSTGGAVYVFKRQAGTDVWLQLAQLMPADSASGDQFGCSVALAADAILVGAHGAASHGAAYVFDASAPLVQRSKLVPGEDRGSDDDQFGFAVAISDDGDTIAVGSPQCPPATYDCGTGAVYLFGRQQQDSNMYTMITAHDGMSGDKFGQALALDGEALVLIGAVGSDEQSVNGGAAYLFVPCHNFSSVPSVVTGSCTRCISGPAGHDCLEASCSAGFRPFDATAGVCCSNFSSRSATLASVVLSSCTSCTGDRDTDCLVARCAPGFAGFQPGLGFCCNDFATEPSVINSSCTACTGPEASECTVASCVDGYLAFSVNSEGGYCHDWMLLIGLPIALVRQTITFLLFLFNFLYGLDRSDLLGILNAMACSCRAQRC